MNMTSFIKKNIVAWALASTFILSPAIAVAHKKIVENGSFEKVPTDVPAGTFTIFPAIPGWDIASTCGGIEIQNKIPGSSPFKGNQLVELDSNCSSTISQTIDTKANKKYDLCFAYSPRPGIVDNKISVSWGNKTIIVIDRDGTVLTDTDWNTYCVRNLKATSATTVLEFSDESFSDSLGGYLDAVSVKRGNNEDGNDEHSKGGHHKGHGKD
jgi:Protein of unknown function (DUF642)